MATYYGPWTGSGRTGRLVVDVNGIPSITSDTGGFQVTTEWFVEFSVNTWDGGASFDTNSSFEAHPVTVPIGSPARPVTRAHVGTRTTWVNPRFDAEINLFVQGTITNINNIGASSRPWIDATVTIPRKPYKRPQPPLNFSYGMTGTRQATLWWGSNWTGNDGAYPWTDLRIDRWDNVGGWVSPRHTIGWDGVTWTDSALINDRAYEYRIRSQGPGGKSDWVTRSTRLYTKPLAPTNVVANKDSAGDIVITWSSPSTIATKWAVYHGDGQTVESTPIATVSERTWKHPNPSVTRPHAYQVRALAPDGTASDLSGSSNDVQLLTAPNAPTSLTPSGATLNRSAAHLRTWQHNGRDRTPQSAYELRSQVSTDNGATWSEMVSTGKVISTSSSRSLPANLYPVDTRIRWQVRTWGGHADPSGWSALHTYEVSGTPSAVITSPTEGEQVYNDLVSLRWSYAGSAIQASYTAILTADGTTVETRSGVGTGTVVDFVYRLSNNTPHTIELVVVDANGLPSAKVVRQFVTKFIGPPAPQTVATWDNGLGTVTLALHNPAPPPGGVVPDAVSTTVERKVGDAYYSLGTYGLDPTLTDPIPTQGTATYRLTTTSALGASTSIEVTVETKNNGDWIWVNYGPNFGLRARARLGGATSSKFSRPRTRHHFVGRRRPVTYYGDERSLSVAVTVLTEEADTIGNRAAWWRAEDEGDLVCFRDHLGRRIFGSLTDISFDEESNDLSSLAFEIEEDDYAE